MRQNLGRRAVAGVLEFGGPEQGVEIEDVLADEVIQLGCRAPGPVVVEVQATAGAEVAERTHVADRRVEPDVEVLSRRTGNLEAEVGRVAGDVPIGELVFARSAQPFLELVGGLGRHVVALLRPAAQELLAARVGELEEVMVGRAHFRHGSGNGGVGVLEVGWRVGGAAHLAGVAVLVLGPALRAFALDEAVGQEHLLDRVVVLLDRAHLDQAGGLEFLVDVLGVEARLVRVRRVVVVEFDMEAGEVTAVLAMDPLDQGLGGDAFLLGAQHDRRAVGVVGADIVALVAAHLLEAHPDVGLDVFDEMAQMDGAVGIGQGGGDENLARGHDGVRIVWDWKF